MNQIDNGIKPQPRILATQYTLMYRSFDIYVSVCKGNPHCENCHNPESWNFNQGEKYDTVYYITHISKKVKNFSSLVHNIMIFFFEFLDSDLGELLFELSILNKPIWLFTHYSLDEVPQYVKNYCKYIKTGRYIPKLKVSENMQCGINLATSNQKIYVKGIDY